jgi:hypothetical protein
VVFIIKYISCSGDLKYFTATAKTGSMKYLGSVLVVALAESSLASIWLVGALDLVLAGLFPLVADELADALGSELHLHTLLAILKK